MNSNANPIQNPTEAKLSKVLKEYEVKYSSNAENLRQAIPPSEMWRFVIDGVKQKEGWLGFEKKEKGYLKSMTTAFHRIFQPTGDLNTLIKELHALATQDVNGTYYDTYSKEKRNEYRIANLDISYGINYVTERGLNELCQMIKEYKELDSFPMIDVGRDAFDTKVTEKTSYIPDAVANAAKIIVGRSTAMKIPPNLASSIYKDAQGARVSLLHLVHVIDPNVGDVNALMNRRMSGFIDQYNESMRTASSQYDKLKIIAHFIQQCERLHPFIDGNTRTFSMLLLNHLLVQNGFPLVIRDDPNDIYAITIEELCDDFIKGMTCTLELASNRVPYDVHTKDLLSKISTNEHGYFKTVETLESKSRLTSKRPRNDGTLDENKSVDCPDPNPAKMKRLKLN